MKILSTCFEPNDTFYISSFGYENISENARWGKGRRDIYILHYVLEGEGYFNEHRVKSGEGFFISPKELHEYHSSLEKPWKYFWVTFGGNAGASICGKYIETNKENIFQFDFKTKLLNLCDSIFSVEGSLSEAKAVSYFFSLLSYHEKKNSIAGNRYVEDAKKYMNVNFYRNVSITEVADALGINDRYLYNLFIKYENISPKQYLSALKLSRAKSMLKNTESPISEIAISSGFQDVLSFSRFFSKNVGLSPTAYRKHKR
ncbi:MAG: AraC family transcriptional regulator [Clostridia bacterium]|nr:AraC family transcriptional regulator [Clostridia bacterium]